MKDRAIHRRASIYRQRARELAVDAEQERGRRFEARRQHLFDQAASYERAADQMEPPLQEKTLVSRGDRTRVTGLEPMFFRGAGDQPGCVIANPSSLSFDIGLRGSAYRRAADQMAPEQPTPIPGQSMVAPVFAERGHHSK